MLGRRRRFGLGRWLVGLRRRCVRGEGGGLVRFGGRLNREVRGSEMGLTFETHTRCNMPNNEKRGEEGGFVSENFPQARWPTLPPALRVTLTHRKRNGRGETRQETSPYHGIRRPFRIDLGEEFGSPC